MFAPSPDHDYQGNQISHSNLPEVWRPSPSPKNLGVLAEEVKCEKWENVLVQRIHLVQVVEPEGVVQPGWVPWELP